jgi:hypothetical protein
MRAVGKLVRCHLKGATMKDSIESVQDFIEGVTSFRGGKERHAHLRLWFRGHGDARWKLEPGVYRSTFGASNEIERLRKERHLSQDFRVGSAGLREGTMTDVDLYFLQQHYGMPTRLLDWTSNALTALYFAVFNESHWKADGEVLMLDAYQFKADIGIGIATGRRDAVKNAIGIITTWPADKAAADLPKTIFPVRPDRFDIRMSLQRAGFTFHVPTQPELTEAVNSTLLRVRVAAGKKKAIRSQLGALGVDHFGVFGDLESLSAQLKIAHEVR